MLKAVRIISQSSSISSYEEGERKRIKKKNTIGSRDLTIVNEKIYHYNRKSGMPHVPEKGNCKMGFAYGLQYVCTGL